MRMINVTKSFFPVGQGGFFVERIVYRGNAKTIVYDCGAFIDKTMSGPTQELKNSIKNSGIRTVDLIVVSHLDEDHINGIPELDDYISRITQAKLPLIMIPKPTSFDILFFLNCASQKMINWYFQAVKDKRIVFVCDIEGKFEKITKKAKDCVLKDNSIKIDNKLAESVLSHHRKFSFGLSSSADFPWILRFYVDKKKYAELKSNDKKIIESIHSYADFTDKKKELKRIYEGVKGKKNGSSMSMVSMPFFNKITELFRLNKNAYVTWMNGDAMLNTKESMGAIESHFRCVKDLHLDFQIPHHGSHHNLNRLPARLRRNIRTYIWAGFANAYGHPSGTILNMIKAKGFEYNLITEKTCAPLVRHETWFIE